VLLALLDSSGARWRLRDKRRHLVLEIEGRAVQAVPRGAGSRRGGRNCLANVRRFLRAVAEGRVR
jgi:hypothetical protein